MRGGAAPVQEAGLGEQERADAHAAEPPHAGHFLQPRRQRRVAHGPCAEPADQEHRIARAFDLREVMARHEAQHAAFARHREIVAGGDDLNRINGSGREPIDRVEDLQRSDEIELVDRWHHNDDDPAARGVAVHDSLTMRRRRSLSQGERVSP